MPLKARETKAKTNCWDFVKIKASAQGRKQSAKLKGNKQNERRYFQKRRYLQMTYLIKGQYLKSIKDLQNSTPKK